MLVGIKVDGNKNPLLLLSASFIDWAKTEGGCWWWIKNGTRECLEAGMMVSSFGSLEEIEKEQIFISEFPFTRYIDLPKDFKTRLRFSTFQDLLIEEWLNFINGDDTIREGLLTNYDILTI